eukprot:m.39031 g.39031  ORF g.39031 m.39031 type:complete len:232 (-) comp10258_c0_seq1:202-897(-)
MSLKEEDVLQKTRAARLDTVKHLNSWGSRLTDASLLKRMPNVEVITLSMNKLTSLSFFCQCQNLRELYLRKNKIEDINEIGYLKELNRLTILWMSDNPVSKTDHYRLTLIRNLPKLEKLDNIDVTEEEREEARTKGVEIDTKSDEAEKVDEDEGEEIKQGGESNSDNVPRLTETISPGNIEAQYQHRNGEGETQFKDANGRAFEAVKTLLPLLTAEQLKELRVIAKRQLLL